MVGIINYWKGYVKIKVRGGSVERFVNLCGNKDLLIWGVVKKEDTYEMYISLQAFYELRSIARKTCTRVVILERYGLPFLLPELQKRMIFTVCAVIVVLFLYGSSRILWDITYEGNMELTNEIIGEFMEEQGVRIGMFTGKLDIEMLEKALRKHFTEITWASLKLDGSRLLVSLKENDAPILEKTESENKYAGQDMIADYEGRIISMIVRKGIPKVKIGDTVKEGTLLVEGKVPVLNEDGTLKEYLYVEADADIELEHVIEYAEELPFYYAQKMYTGRERIRYFLRYDKTEMRIRNNGTFFVCDVETRTLRPEVFEKLDIPLYIGSIRYREYYNVEKKYTTQEAYEKLNDKMNQFIGILEQKGVQIIEKDVKISINEKGWINSGNITVIENIERKYPTLIENIDSGE